jgi:hypothetical protein
MATYGPSECMQPAAVVNPASLHLVNIFIVSYGLHIVKLDDPKAFCKGDLCSTPFMHTARLV